MNQPLTPAEKQLIEREFIAHEQVEQKRRSFLTRVFWVGITTGSTYGLLCGLVWERHELPLLQLLKLGLLLIYLGCSVVYTEFFTMPRTFSQDLDPRWHWNRWEDILDKLKDEERRHRTLMIWFAPVVLYPVGLILRKTFGLFFLN